MNIGATYQATNLFGNQVVGILLAQQIGGTPILKDAKGNLHPIVEESLNQVKPQVIEDELSDLYVDSNNRLCTTFVKQPHEVVGLMHAPFGEAYVLRTR